LIEIQALTSPVVVEGVQPRRTTEGFSRNRLSIILAVLEKKNKIALSYKDVFLNVVGGMEIEEPGADLGVAMAIYSSEKNYPVDAQTLIIGEVGLSGEVRPVGQIEQLLNEAEKVGFKTCILPEKNHERVIDKFKKMKLHPVQTVQAAIDILFAAAPAKGSK
jgi:DNA repair protein RadA/Sms